jgi:hypothetical protein
MSAPHVVPERLAEGSRRALLAGAGGLALSAIGALFNTTEFLRSYLLAFLFWSGASIGCLSLLLIQHLTGGRWGLLVRRLLEAGTRTIPYAALAFLPIALGVGRLYEWGHPDAHDAILQHKSPYLNPGFFRARAAFYFVVWSAIAYFVNAWSLRLDAGPDRRIERRLRGLSGGGLVMLGLTITFSSIDWGMSLEPHWISTIYGVMFMVGQVLTAFTLVILALRAFGGEEPFRRVVRRETIHDLGKLLFAFVMLWTYVHLSQFLIIWSANVPEEIPWYIRRINGGWLYVAWVVIAAHFIAPFMALLSRDLKRNLQQLATVAALVLAARWLDLFWIIAPALDRPRLSVHWMDVTTAVGLGGLWLGLFARELAGRSMVPLNQPDLEVAAEQA